MLIASVPWRRSTDLPKEGAKGRFRVYNGDFFANRVLWDSGEMTKGSPAKEIDIALKDVHCLMLTFEGDEALGNWGDARVARSRERIVAGCL